VPVRTGELVCAKREKSVARCLMYQKKERESGERGKGCHTGGQFMKHRRASGTSRTYSRDAFKNTERRNPREGKETEKEGTGWTADDSSSERTESPFTRYFGGFAKKEN